MLGAGALTVSAASPLSPRGPAGPGRPYVQWWDQAVTSDLRNTRGHPSLWPQAQESPLTCSPLSPGVPGAPGAPTTLSPGGPRSPCQVQGPGSGVRGSDVGQVRDYRCRSWGRDIGRWGTGSEVSKAGRVREAQESRVRVRAPHLLALKSFRSFGTNTARWPRGTTGTIIAPGTWEAPDSWGPLGRKRSGLVIRAPKDGATSREHNPLSSP